MTRSSRASRLDEVRFSLYEQNSSGSYMLRDVCYGCAVQPDKGDESSGTNYASTTGTVSRSGVPAFPGAENIMSEMTLRLRERRARTENSNAVNNNDVVCSVCHAEECAFTHLCIWMLNVCQWV